MLAVGDFGGGTELLTTRPRDRQRRPKCGWQWWSSRRNRRPTASWLSPAGKPRPSHVECDHAPKAAMYVLRRDSLCGLRNPQQLLLGDARQGSETHREAWVSTRIRPFRGRLLVRSVETCGWCWRITSRSRSTSRRRSSAVRSIDRGDDVGSVASAEMSWPAANPGQHRVPVHGTGGHRRLGAEPAVIEAGVNAARRASRATVIRSTGLPAACISRIAA